MDDLIERFEFLTEDQRDELQLSLDFSRDEGQMERLKEKQDKFVEERSKKSAFYNKIKRD